MDTNILPTSPDKVPAREETPHGCYDGWVYLGLEREVDGENADEEIGRVACGRCLRRRSPLGSGLFRA